MVIAMKRKHAAGCELCMRWLESKEMTGTAEYAANRLGLEALQESIPLHEAELAELKEKMAGGASAAPDASGSSKCAPFVRHRGSGAPAAGRRPPAAGL